LIGFVQEGVKLTSAAITQASIKTDIGDQARILPLELDQSISGICSSSRSLSDFTSQPINLKIG